MDSCGCNVFEAVATKEVMSLVNRVFICGEHEAIDQLAYTLTERLVVRFGTLLCRFGSTIVEDIQSYAILACFQTREHQQFLTCQFRRPETPIETVFLKEMIRCVWSSVCAEIIPAAVYAKLRDCGVRTRHIGLPDLIFLVSAREYQTMGYGDGVPKRLQCLTATQLRALQAFFQEVSQRRGTIAPKLTPSYPPEAYLMPMEVAEEATSPT